MKAGNMKTFLFLSLLTSLFMGLGADEITIMDVSKINPKHHLPTGWYLSKLRGFTPAPKVEFPEENGKKVLHIFDVKGSGGCRFDCYTKHLALKGDKIILYAEVRGTGKGVFTVQAYHQKKWMGHIGIKDFPVTADWQKVKVEFTVNDLADNWPTTSVICMFGTQKDADIYVRSLSLERQAEIAGTARFPNIWTAFLPMDRNYSPTEKELTEIPAELNGVKPRKIQFSAGEHDFKNDFPGPGPLEYGSGNCAWLYAAVDCDKDEDYTIGAGADWWMQVNVNGKPVIDTLKVGNTLHPPRLTDHKATVRLKRGRNIFAVKYVTGAGSAILALGGPDQLRWNGQALRMVEELWKDDFENAETKRAGAPQVIQGEYSYALVGPSRQAVYTAAPKLVFAPGRTEFTMPKIASGKMFSMTQRLVKFEGDEGKLSYRFLDPKNGKDMVLELIRKPDDQLTIQVSENHKTVQTFSCPGKLFPLDLMFAVNAIGDFKIILETLADSSVQSFSGKSSFFAGIDEKVFQAEAILEADRGGKIQLTADDWCYGYAMPEQIKKVIPMDIRIDQTFDPKKAGWKLVLDEEFNGTELDPKIWFRTGEPAAVKVRNGMLEITPVKVKAKGKDMVCYRSGAISTIKHFPYGYFEARLRFRRHNGWNTAFWLYGGQTGNSFLDGMEIDIYEDYYVTKERPLLDFNFHGFVGRVMKSWNYVSLIPGSLEDFYTIGCKWTPFEITYYLNGKAIKSTANHSPHKTVTYDALTHRNGFVPLRISLFGTVRAPYGKGQPIKSKGKFPDVFKVDYVRYWAYPHDKDPVVRLKKKDDRLLIAPGEKFEIEAVASPNPKTKLPIKAAYLFDSGCIIDYKDKPPYKFTVSIDEKYYSGTNYMRTGRSREKPNLKAVLHAYSIFVQDAAGKVANSEVVMKMTRPEKQSTPYQGKAQVIPGKINPCLYDEGGNGVAYLDDKVNANKKSGFRVNEGVDATGAVIGHVLTGEWVNLTVDIREAGRYKVTMDYGAPNGFGGSMLMILDDRKLIGTFQLPNGGGTGWGGLKSTLDGIELPAGRHVVKLIAIGAFNYSYLDFQLEK
ncbi:MAG: glycosyl hydrolase family protein [Lentisphaerae bacterium]|nr:glycosyl hydrolase family protein [Lentisphaerota bacterium]